MPPLHCSQTSLPLFLLSRSSARHNRLIPFSTRICRHPVGPNRGHGARDSRRSWYLTCPPLCRTGTLWVLATHHTCGPSSPQTIKGKCNPAMLPNPPPLINHNQPRRLSSSPLSLQRLTFPPPAPFCLTHILMLLRRHRPPHLPCPHSNYGPNKGMPPASLRQSLIPHHHTTSLLPTAAFHRQPSRERGHSQSPRLLPWSRLLIPCVTFTSQRSNPTRPR